MTENYELIDNEEKHQYEFDVGVTDHGMDERVYRTAEL